MISKLCSYFSRALRKQRFHLLSNPLVQARLGSGRQVPIEDFAVEGMHKLVAIGDRAVGKLLRPRRPHHQSPVRQAFAKIRKFLLFHIRGRGRDPA